MNGVSAEIWALMRAHKMDVETAQNYLNELRAVTSRGFTSQTQEDYDSKLRQIESKYNLVS